MDDLIHQAAQCECPSNQGCNVPSPICRCEVMEKLVNRMIELEAALARYSCKCSEPCALYEAEKARENDMPHMMCGWWARSVLGEK